MYQLEGTDYDWPTDYSGALRKAVLGNDLSALNRVLADDESNNERNIDINEPLRRGMTALHVAISYGNVQMVRLLLKNDARIDLKDESGKNCLELAAGVGRPTRHDMINLCLQSIGTDIYGLKYPIVSNVEPLEPKRHFFYYEYDLYDIVEFLLINKADPNVRDANFNNFTPLDEVISLSCHRVESKKAIALIKLLLRHGADPNVRDRYGCTPFYRSFTYNDADLIDFFITRGAMITSKNNARNAVFYAIANKMPQVLRRLIKMNINVNQAQFAYSTYYSTPLHVLFAHSRDFDDNWLAIANLLIDQGADVNALDSDKETPLCRTSRGGCLKSARYLLSRGADVNGHKENNPLFFAVIKGNSEMIDFLLDSGANANCRDRHGRSLLHYAMRFEEDLVPTLVEKGARIGDDQEGLTSAQFTWLISCQREILRMQETKVSNSCGTTCFDILAKRRNALVNCIRFTDVYNEMGSDDYKQKFSIFYRRLKANYLSGLKRMLMQDDLQSILDDVFGNTFPEEIIPLIINLLSNEELKGILRPEYMIP